MINIAWFGSNLEITDSSSEVKLSSEDPDNSMFILTFPGIGDDKNYYRAVISDAEIGTSQGIHIQENISGNIVVTFENNAIFQ